MHSLLVSRDQINRPILFKISYSGSNIFVSGQKAAENLFRVAGGIRRLPALKYIPATS